jgi:hypothetical protein
MKTGNPQSGNAVFAFRPFAIPKFEFESQRHVMKFCPARGCRLMSDSEIQNLTHRFQSPATMEPSDNILAFRSITSALSILQDGPISKPTRFIRNTVQVGARELRSLDSIATLLVRNNEVVSAATTEQRAMAVCI